MYLKTFHIIGIPESGLIEAHGQAEAKEKAFHHFQACYGNNYNILDIVDVSNRDIRNKDKHMLI